MMAMTDMMPVDGIGGGDFAALLKIIRFAAIRG